MTQRSVAFFSRLFRREQLSLFPAVACLLLPLAAWAQVTYTGPHKSVGVGSQPVGSPSGTISLPFAIGAGTEVGSIAVLTTGITGMDFAQVRGTTCTAMTYSTATNCVVNVNFTPLAAGPRRGAVVFYSGAPGTSTALATVPIFGLGTGPQVVFDPASAQTSFGHSFISPEGVAVDAGGNVYITDTGLQEVFKVTPSGKQSAVGSGLLVPEGVAVDGAGNVYITDSQSAAVFKVTPGGTQTTLGSGWDYPSGIAVDGSGNAYVSDPFIDAVFKVAPGGKEIPVGGGYNTPAGVAVDTAGNVYVADTYAAAVFKITPGGTQTTIGTSFVSPAGVSVDAAGDVYVTDTGADTVYEVTPGGVQSTVMSGLDVPNGVALDGSGNLYVANTYEEEVLKIERVNAPLLRFASTPINSTSDDSPKTVEVENIGNRSLKFSALTYPADFPEGISNPDNDCTSSTRLAASSACALTIDFSPVTPLGSNTSVVLKEAVKLTTNNLNGANTRQRVVVMGKELP